MKTATVAFTASIFVSLVAAAPTPTQNKRTATSDCAQYGETTLGSYIVYNDLWGEANGSGSQCVTVTGVSDSSLTWSTEWSWANNPDDVKSYSNAVYSFTATELSGISSMESTFDWSYTGDSVVADVSYDMFTSSSATGSEEYEVMVWLAALGGAGPISATYSASGNAEPIATPTVAGHSFSLYKGSNGVQTVYSFVGSENITSFSGDVYGFFKYLINSQSFDSSQYLVSVGAGTEAFTGSNAEFTVSGYSMDIVTGSGSSTVATSSAAVSPTSSSAVVATSIAAASTAATDSSVVVVATSVSSYAAPTTSVAATGTVAPYPTGTGAAQSSGALWPTGWSSYTASAAYAPSSSAFAVSSVGTPSPEPNCKLEYVYV